MRLLRRLRGGGIDWIEEIIKSCTVKERDGEVYVDIFMSDKDIDVMCQAIRAKLEERLKSTETRIFNKYGGCIIKESTCKHILADVKESLS